MEEGVDALAKEHVDRSLRFSTTMMGARGAALSTGRRSGPARIALDHPVEGVADAGFDLSGVDVTGSLGVLDAGEDVGSAAGELAGDALRTFEVLGLAGDEEDALPAAAGEGADGRLVPGVVAAFDHD